MLSAVLGLGLSLKCFFPGLGFRAQCFGLRVYGLGYDLGLGAYVDAIQCRGLRVPKRTFAHLASPCSKTPRTVIAKTSNAARDTVRVRVPKGLIHEVTRRGR